MSELQVDDTKLIHHIPVLRKWLSDEEFFPVHVEISPSSACNHRCILCYVDFKKHKPAQLEKEILLGLVNDFKKFGVKSFLLAGEGEPTLNTGIVEMLNVSKKAGVDAALNTNGILYDEAMIRETIESLQWLRFTMQASSPSLYSRIHRAREQDFHKALRNIESAVRIKRDRNIQVTLGLQQILINENVEDVFGMARLAKELGVDYFIVKKFSAHPHNAYSVPDELYKHCLDQFDKVESLESSSFTPIVRRRNFSDKWLRTYPRCLGLPFLTQIIADGRVVPCSMFFGEEEACYGNLHEASFADIWLSEKRKRLQSDIEKNLDVADCITYCRHHNINKFLWKLSRKPAHVNFI